MRNKIISALTIFSVCALLACGAAIRNPAAVGENKLSGNVNGRLVSATNQFGFDLFNKLRLKDRNQNIFYSPLSVTLALAMTYNGAAGETQAAMARTLKIEGLGQDELNQASAALLKALKSADPKVELLIANSLWSRQGVKFNEAFLERNRQFFGAEISSLNFADPSAVNTINNWVSRNTKNKIPTIMDRIDARDVMFLINAIYFKGLWEKKFDQALTRNEPFHQLSGASKTVPMMSQAGDYPYYQGDKFQAVRLFYGQKGASLELFLPDQGSSVEELMQNLTLEKYDQWAKNLRPSPGDLKIPRFKAAYESSLNEALAALGMGPAFNPTQADFSGMRPEKDVFISQVKHKAILEVNEEGTVAAAVTSVGVRTTSLRQRFTFTADRPFLMVIKDQATGTILFMGVIKEV